jgi:hypothetical protein
MSIENNQPQPPSPRIPSRRGPALAGVIVALISVGLLVAVLATRGDDEVAGASANQPTVKPTTTVAPTTTINIRNELVSRLGEILRERQRAYRERDAEGLSTIYTIDCPCLESDSNAIRELVSNRYFWVGGASSFRVRHLERVTSRQWLVIGIFSSEPLRIETESGRLVRSEPGGSELFQFVLAKPQGSHQWLLGRASSYKEG